MILVDEHIVLAVNHLLSSNKIIKKKEPNNLAAARVIIKDMFEYVTIVLYIFFFSLVMSRMKTIQSIRLRTQINCLYFKKDFNHLLVGVKDGKLFVLTAEKKSLAKNPILKL